MCNLSDVCTLTTISKINVYFVIFQFQIFYRYGSYSINRLLAYFIQRLTEPVIG